jgi:membrane fusion protein, heavy metal efflux system
MMKKIKHVGLAVGVFIVIAGGFLWLTGTFSKTGKAVVGKSEGVAGTGGKSDEAKPSEGGAPAKVLANLDLKAIETKLCEHKIRQIDCDECRYELGVVKVQTSVTDALTKTAVVQQGELADRLRLTGEVQYDQTCLVDVLPIASGKVVSVKARLGQKVSQGDVLAVIHSGDFGEAKATYLETVAGADIAVKERERQAAVSTALEKLLDMLAKGQSFADGNSTPLGEWKSKLIGAAARLRQAQVVFEREKSLVAKQASSKAELETAERELQTAQADYAAMAEEIQLNLNLDRLKAENAARLAEARLNAAEQRLHLFGLDDQAVGSISHGKENGSFAQLEIKAPRAGVITAQNVTEGKFVETTQCLFTVADTSNVWVWCDLYERDLGVLHEYLLAGNTPKASVQVSAFKDPMSGTLDLIGSAVDETTRTVKVRVQVKNEQGKLKPGMFAAVTVELPTGKKVVVAPRQAVLSDEGTYFAFQHWKDDLWLKRDVVVSKAQDDMVEITGGLEPGAKVVVSGAFLFKSDVLRAKMGAGCAD